MGPPACGRILDGEEKSPGQAGEEEQQETRWERLEGF